MGDGIVIEAADLTASGFVGLVDRHVSFCDQTAPADSCHRLTMEELDSPDLTIWQIRNGAEIVGMGGLKSLSPEAGEVKSMHVLSEARGSGAAKSLLREILAEAEARGYATVSLETGVHPDFAAARALYSSFGFQVTGPFGDYIHDPHSLFMQKTLTTQETI